MAAYRCPTCSTICICRANWARSIKCRRCGRIYAIDGNRISGGVMNVKEARNLLHEAIDRIRRVRRNEWSQDTMSALNNAEKATMASVLELEFNHAEEEEPASKSKGKKSKRR